MSSHELGTVAQDRGEGLTVWLIGFSLLVIMPLLNVLPEPDSWLHVSDLALNRFGKFLAFAILALGLYLIWGYTWFLSLGDRVFVGCCVFYVVLHVVVIHG